VEDHFSRLGSDSVEFGLLVAAAAFMVVNFVTGVW